MKFARTKILLYPTPYETNTPEQLQSCRSILTWLFFYFFSLKYFYLSAESRIKEAAKKCSFIKYYLLLYKYLTAVSTGWRHQWYGMSSPLSVHYVPYLQWHTEIDRENIWQQLKKRTLIALAEQRMGESLQVSSLPYFKSTSSSGFYLPLFFVLEMIQDIQDNLIAEDVLILQGEEDQSAYYVSSAALGANASFGVRVLFCLLL